MVCIHCSSETQIINSRPQKRSNQVWRRRKCRHCQAVFSTQEHIDYHAAWVVQNNSTAVAPFSRDKLYLSIHKSISHRKHSISDATALTDTIINKLLPTSRNGSLQTKQILHMTQVALNRFDKVASIHYQAFHKLL